MESLFKYDYSRKREDGAVDDEDDEANEVSSSLSFSEYSNWIK